MEKRRRARINNCLNELKTLILDAMKKDVSIIFEIHIFPFTTKQVETESDSESREEVH
jgi:hypothetical protein